MSLITEQVLQKGLFVGMATFGNRVLFFSCENLRFVLKLPTVAGSEEKSTASTRGMDPEPHTEGGERGQQYRLSLSKAPQTIWLYVRLASALAIHPFLSTESLS